MLEAHRNYYSLSYTEPLFIFELAKNVLHCQDPQGCMLGNIQSFASRLPEEGIAKSAVYKDEH
jgi:hypothetical protein